LKGAKMLILAETNVPGIEIDGGLLILLVITFALVCRYLIARMRHKETMAAIEKGLSLSELKTTGDHSTRWLTSITFGIILLLIGPCLILFSLPFWNEWKPSLFLEFGPEGIIPIVVPFIGIVFIIIGIANLISGRLQKKAEMSKTNTNNISNKAQ
jgi:sterol desaturase/sphingolipid hydroxylase (fatty acid hydroxylase superfamily)